MRARFLLAVGVLLTSFLAPRLGSAGCLYKAKANTPYVAWTPLPVTYRVSDNLTDAKLLAAIDAAFQAWGSTPCSKLKFVKGQPFKACAAKPCATGTVDFDHGTPYLYVFWFTTDWDQFKDPTDPKVKYASMSFFWQNNIGGIVGASIAVNAKDYTFSPDASTGCTGAVFDMHDFMMPLIGGVSGLTDSNVAGSVMSPDLKFCSIVKRTLTADDKLGLVYLYKESSTCVVPTLDANGCYSSGTTPTKDGGTTPAKDGGGTTPGDGGTTPAKEGGTTPGLEAGTPGTDSGTGQGCTSNAQCASDEICAVDGKCVKTGGESGCCRVSHGGAELSSAWPLLICGLILLALLRRRS
jgi:hypothetical protein